MSSNKNIPLFDMDHKLSSSTFFTDKPSACDCNHLDPDTLKQKLEQILFSLQHQIDLRTQQLEAERHKHKENLQEKDDIIERLVQANNILSQENQQLRRMQKSDRQYFEYQLNQYQQSLAAQKKQLNAVINYLEHKNHDLTRHLNLVTSPKSSNTKFSQVFDSTLASNLKEHKIDSNEISTVANSSLKKVSSLNYLIPPTAYYHNFGQTQSDFKNYNLRHLKRSRANFQKMEKLEPKGRVSNLRLSRNLFKEEYKGSRAF